jgi:hypothetical protein
VSLGFAASAPMPICADQQVLDGGGAGNGLLDPGEEADLVLSLKNFGSAASDVEVTLQTDDNFVEVEDGSATFGNIAAGAVGTNATNPFRIRAPLLARRGHIVEFTVLASYAGGQTESHFLLCLGKFSFLVWDPTGEQSSGPVIMQTLESLGYRGGYRQSLEHTDLALYSTVFVSLGIYANTYQIAYDAAEATALIGYLNQGGCLYLEGGDAWVYAPANGGFDFSPYFRIVPLQDGSPDLSYVTGRPGVFSAGMRFQYSGENQYIDHITRTGAGAIVFDNESPAYTIGIAYQSGVYKTIGVSFEFAGLTDGALPSTRAALAQAIMNFFLPDETQAAPEPIWSATRDLTLAPAAPNPFSASTTLRYALAGETRVRIGLFDAAGRCVRSLEEGARGAGDHTLELPRGDLAPGLYFIRARTGNTTLSRKCVIAD